MKATTLYRIAAVLLILFAVGHTFGFLNFTPPSSEARAVREAMKGVHFQIGGARYSYAGFYTGFGLFVTVYLLFSAFLAWHLGGLARSNPQAVGALGWVFCAVQGASFGLSWIYFSVAPALLSAFVTVCVGWAAWLVRARP